VAGLLTKLTADPSLFHVAIAIFDAPSTRPQNHATWIKLAGPLAKDLTCVIADLPGYGASSIPADTPDHEGFSKRRMASLLVSAMTSMGHATFSVMGHDRGARVAYRMALDHPATIRAS
jgi:haloacetate dehalogenase